MEAQDALDIAKTAEPVTPAFVAENDPQNLTLGMKVSIAVDEDSGEEPVVGEVRFADRETIAVLISNDQVGTVCVHFPRVGYRIEICE